jgi:nucleoside-diphosphate-sugar epimerase
VLECPLNQPINLGNPNEMSVLDLGKRIIKITNSKSKIVHEPLPVDDPKVRCPDITLAKRMLNWTPQVKLDDGLEKTIQYFKESISRR